MPGRGLAGYIFDRNPHGGDSLPEHDDLIADDHPEPQDRSHTARLRCPPGSFRPDRSPAACRVTCPLLRTERKPATRQQFSLGRLLRATKDATGLGLGPLTFHTVPGDSANATSHVAGGQPDHVTPGHHSSPLTVAELLASTAS